MIMKNLLCRLAKKLFGGTTTSSSATPAHAYLSRYTEEEIAAAYHEAGHAALVLFYESNGFRLTGNITRQDSDGGGLTPWSPGNIREVAAGYNTQKRRLDAMAPLFHVMWAGGRAEVKQTGNGAAANGGIRDDVRLVVREAQNLVRFASAQAMTAALAPYDEQATDHVEHLWPKIEAIAKLLLEKTTITPKEARQAFDEAR
ncbi:hypothetical protein [Azospirillum argentinense]|uniref:hypothetical protein n=1 Tax=Azospirillum argentinense TaxID=2970906 RepID=UPI0032DEFE6B